MIYLSSPPAPSVRAQAELLPSDDAVYSVLDGALVPLAVRLARRLGLFQALASGVRTVAALGAALGLAERPVEALASACAVLGLLRRSGPRGSLLELAPAARAYFLPGGEWSMVPLFELIEEQEGKGGSAFDEGVAGDLRRAIESDRSPFEQEGASLWERMRTDAGLARRFSAAMAVHSRPAASVWPHRIDLSGARHLLDVAGGTGVHALAALAAYPRLRATVLDLPLVARLAEEAARAASEPRLRAAAGDLWHDPWPEADAHFFSDVFHDWSPARCAELAARSFAALPEGGLCLLHEMLLDDDRSGPFPVVAGGLSLLLWCEGRPYNAEDLREMLSEAGFVDLRVERTLGCWGVVSGRKPVGGGR